METDLAKEERQLNHLKQLGVFEKISGLLISKPEKFTENNHRFSYHDLLNEILAGTEFPVIINFDCGHRHPMITIAQGVECELIATNKIVSIRQLEMGVK